ncbi:MAG: radical SAM protein, partial [candidate division WOR-3 bacterium]
MGYISLFDPFKDGLCTCEKKYTINPYTGCNHRCRYCYITSYIRDGFKLRLKKNYVEIIKREIKKIKNVYPFNLSSSSDPYPEIEKKLLLTRKTLILLKEKNFKVSIITKSPLVLRDIDIFKKFKNIEIGFSIGTADENIRKIFE